MKILVVEDRHSLADHLRRALETEGHEVTLACDGEDALRQARTNEFQLLLLDVNLPRRDGFSVIRQMREDRLATATIMVSARDSMQDIIQGLDAGADDYLTKPFALAVLLAKVRAAERRIPEAVTAPLTYQDLTLRPHLFEVQRGERTAALTRTECILLETLMRRPRAVVTHQMLIDAGWGSDAEVSQDSLYVFIRALRSKLTQAGETDILHTVRGVGYTLRAEL